MSGNSKKISVVNNYSALVRKIQDELNGLDSLIKRQTAEVYWKIGKFIHEHLLEYKGRADYGHKLFERLEKNVNRDKTTLRKILQFYRAYPIGADRRQLTWSHYKVLVAVKGQKERKEIERKIIDKDWNSTDLENYLQKQKSSQIPKDGPIPALKFIRGAPNVFEVIRDDSSQSDSGLVIDFGFRVTRDIPDKKPLTIKEGDFVSWPELSKVSVKRDEIYTYRAEVKKIIDGDTLIVKLAIDEHVAIRQKLRLREIDTPEMDTDEGKKAKRFVESRLKNYEFIVIKTYKDRTDKFDRYLADVFYRAGEPVPSVVAQEGNYLNQELLDERLAHPYD